MFSKSKINEPGPKAPEVETKAADMNQPKTTTDFAPSAPKAKPPASVLSPDLTIVGNLKTTGDIQIEGTVEGDIRAHLLTVGEGATVKGEIVADDVVINGRIIGRVRGLKVRLTSTARVEGDIIHKTIAIDEFGRQGRAQAGDGHLLGPGGRGERRQLRVQDFRRRGVATAAPRSLSGI